MPENPRIEELRRRVESDPASIAFAALAEEYRRLGRHEEAVQTCLAGLQRHPAYLSARVTLARALVETGDLDSAREQFETVLRTAPENLAAIRGLAQIHDRLGQSTEMDPHLAQLMREHAEAASQPRPAPAPIEPRPVPVETKPVQPEPPPARMEPEPVRVEQQPVRVEPQRAAIEPELFQAAPPALPEPQELPHPLEMREPVQPEPLEPLERLELLEPARQDPSGPEAFDLPLEPLAAVPFIDFKTPEVGETLETPELPDPAVAAAISRLERFLAAIQDVRHA